MQGSIECTNLTKTYRNFKRRRGVRGAFCDLFHRQYFETVAVDGVTFSIPPGQIVGYIGPNGAGKSTTIKMLTGILRPTSGKAIINGLIPWENRYQFTRKIGVVFGQRTQLWWDIAVQEAYELLRRIYDIDYQDYKKRLDRLSHLLGLQDFLPLPVRKLSLGQRMRADIAASLLHNPPVLFLDEPTIGLDVEVKARIRDFIKAINAEINTTVILTTHDLSDIESLCRRVILLDRGRVVYDGQLSRLKAAFGREIVVHLEFDADIEPQRLAEILPAGVQILAAGKRRAEVEFDRNQYPPPVIITAVMNEAPIRDFAIDERDLSAIIMDLYKRQKLGLRGGYINENGNRTK